MVIVVVLVSLVICAIAVTVRDQRLGRGRKVKVSFIETESGSTLYAGHGNSIGKAVINGFSKMYSCLSANSRIETIERNLASMKKTLADYSSRMTKRDIEECENYIRLTNSLLTRKKTQQEAKELSRSRAEQEKKKLIEEKHAEQEKLRQEKQRQIAEAREEKEKGLPEHKRFIAEQRRLMTDSLRYDVMHRDQFRCQLCGATAEDGVKLHVDHILPVSKGGKTELSNLRTLCERCNMGKGSKIENAKPFSKQDEPSIISPAMERKTVITQKPQEMTTSVFSTVEEFLQHLKENEIPYIDKRSAGGCLWVKSTLENDEFFSKITVCSKNLIKARTTSHFNGQPGWYYKDAPCRISKAQ